MFRKTMWCHIVGQCISLVILLLPDECFIVENADHSATEKERGKLQTQHLCILKCDATAVANTRVWLASSTNPCKTSKCLVYFLFLSHN